MVVVVRDGSMAARSVCILHALRIACTQAHTATTPMRKISWPPLAPGSTERIRKKRKSVVAHLWEWTFVWKEGGGVRSRSQA